MGRGKRGIGEIGESRKREAYRGEGSVSGERGIPGRGECEWGGMEGGREGWAGDR